MNKSPTPSVALTPIQRTNLDHTNNQKNANKGTNGTNKANAHVHGNRGTQMKTNRRAG